MARRLRNVLCLLLGLALGVLAAGCGTIAGLGRDLTSLSEGISGTQADHMKAMDEHRPVKE